MSVLFEKEVKVMEVDSVCFNIEQEILFKSLG